MRVPIGVYQNIGLTVLLSECGWGLGSVYPTPPCSTGDPVSGLEFLFYVLWCQVGVSVGIICVDFV